MIYYEYTEMEPIKPHIMWQFHGRILMAGDDYLLKKRAGTRHYS
jgi:hypothetical protein